MNHPVPQKVENVQKYAVIIGGKSSGSELNHHESARVVIASSMGLKHQGYSVTTLFGSGRESDTDKLIYPQDYKKIQSLQSGNLAAVGTATSQSIDSVLEALVSKVNEGDQVEIVVHAHGRDSCDQLGEDSPKQDLNHNCEHRFVVFDSEGNEVEYSSEKIFDYLKKLEDKGALPSLVLQSCNSGRAKASFRKRDLTKTCVFFMSAGNESGFSCFESDSDSVKDYTSTGEYILMRYYQSILKSLKEDSYFKKSTCFKKTIDHFEKNKMNLNTISEAFWSSRKKDATAQSPALSTLIKIPYFTDNHMKSIQKEPCVSCQQTFGRLDPIQNLLVTQDEIDKQMMEKYNQSLNKYNEAVSNLAQGLAQNSTVVNNENGVKLQEKVKKASEDFVLRERELIHYRYYEQYKKKFSSPSQQVKGPCERPL